MKKEGAKVLDYIYKYSYSGDITDKKKQEDIEIILFNNRIPYKLVKDGEKLKVYVGMIHEEIGKTIVENLNSDNLIYQKAIELEDHLEDSKPRRRRYMDFRVYMMIFFLLVIMLMFLRAFSYLSIN